MNKTLEWTPPARAGEALFLPAARPCADSPLLVLLPGAYSTPGDAVEHGLSAALAVRHPSANLLVLPLDPLAVTEGAALACFDAALAPWRGRFATLWLAGISLGALVLLAYLAERPQGVAGALALTPYLGSRQLEAQIRAAGGPAGWAAANEADWDERHLEERVWRWLGEGGAERLPVELGLAEADRFYSSQALARECWPAERCLEIAGGHDWAAWRALWTAWLDRVPSWGVEE
ncbi:hypothetical protein OL229_17360 [Neisseriaceae bacterium JH1-16]|nr:hypothetical protein [Neisseriaceae bacterium JH1-16]